MPFSVGLDDREREEAGIPSLGKSSRPIRLHHLSKWIERPPWCRYISLDDATLQEPVNPIKSRT